MTLKTILVHLASADRAAALLDVAVPLAARNGAHLVGLHVTPELMAYRSEFIPAELPPELVDETRQWLDADVAAVHMTFVEMTGRADVKAEWRIEESQGPNVYPAVCRHALCSDLIVASQTSIAPLGSGGSLVSDLVFASGRPVLLVPSAGAFPRLGQRVLIAWNGRREAARAAFDALPILKDAERVHVLSIDAPSERSVWGLAPAGDLALALARHGVNAEAASSASGTISVADDILARLADESCDLLVMGCYGHSRFREALLGEVTRHILQHMPVPVLMSH